MAYVYILECADGSFYTGSTRNLERRLQQHHQGKGARYTAKHLPVRLVYWEEWPHIGAAFEREKQIQGWSRKKKQALIAGEFESLPELSACQNSSHFRHASEQSPQPVESREGSESPGASFLPTGDASRTTSLSQQTRESSSLREIQFPERSRMGTAPQSREGSASPGASFLPTGDASRTTPLSQQISQRIRDISSLSEVEWERPRRAGRDLRHPVLAFSLRETLRERLRSASGCAISVP